MHIVRMWTAVFITGLWACATLASHHHIRQTSRLADVLQTAGEGTLVLLDFDNTLVEARQMFATDQFFEAYVDHLMRETGCSEDLALRAARRLFRIEHMAHPPLLIEPEIPKMIREAEERGAIVLVETARQLEAYDYTEIALDHNGIILSEPFGPIQSVVLEPGKPRSPMFRRGIIYCNFQHKGHVIHQFLRALPPSQLRRIKRIVVSDDKLSNVEKMVAAALDFEHEQTRYTFKVEGYEYTACHAKIRDFRLEVAMLQLQQWQKGNVLTDEQAQQHLIARASCQSNVFQPQSKAVKKLRKKVKPVLKTLENVPAQRFHNNR